MVVSSPQVSRGTTTKPSFLAVFWPALVREREREREMVLGVAATAAAGVSSPLQWKPRAVRSIEARGYYAFLGGGHPPSPSLSGSR